jgi:hypothetical protein
MVREVEGGGQEVPFGMHWDANESLGLASLPSALVMRVEAIDVPKGLLLWWARGREVERLLHSNLCSHSFDQKLSMILTFLTLTLPLAMSLALEAQELLLKLLWGLLKDWPHVVVMLLGPEADGSTLFSRDGGLSLRQKFHPFLPLLLLLRRGAHVEINGQRFGMNKAPTTPTPIAIPFPLSLRRGSRGVKCVVKVRCGGFQNWEVRGEHPLLIKSIQGVEIIWVVWGAGGGVLDVIDRQSWVLSCMRRSSGGRSRMKSSRSWSKGRRQRRGRGQRTISFGSGSSLCRKLGRVAMRGRRRVIPPIREEKWWQARRSKRSIQWTSSQSFEQWREIRIYQLWNFLGIFCGGFFYSIKRENN